MMMKKYQTICLTILFLLTFVSVGFSAADRTVKEALKDSIYNTYGIKIFDYVETNGNTWSEYYLKKMIEVFKDLPQDFVSCTRMVFMDPGQEQFEIKYNGYNEEYGIIQVGYGAFFPPAVYLKKFKEVYQKDPTNEDCANRFKCMLVRGMTYSFIQENTDGYGRSELMQAYQAVYAENPSFPTKIYSIGDENFMVVAPGKNHLWTDLAFAVEQYCTNASGLKSNYPKRYEFVKEKVFGGCGVDGWPNKSLSGTGSTSGGDGHTGDYKEPDFGTDTNIDTGTITATDTDPGTDPSTETGTNTGTSTGTDTETDPDKIPAINDRDDIPPIPNEDYLPVVSQLNTGANDVDSSMRNMPDGMKEAIKELFKELPKSFTTCTIGINYMPTTDTCDAFASEGYVFVTNNSWYAPSSFVNLDEATRKKRFKEILLREMTKCYLYYHGSQITRWRGVMGKEITNEEAKIDIVESAVMYYEDPQYLESLKALKWSFIKSNLFSNQTITPTPPADTDTGTNTGTDSGVDTGTDTGGDTGTTTGSDTGTNTGGDTGTDTEELSIELTIKNKTSEPLIFGNNGKDVCLIIYGDDLSGGSAGYISLYGKFMGDHDIPVGYSITATCKFDDFNPKYSGYPFATQAQLQGKWKSNAAIYKSDGNTYRCAENLTGKFISGNKYTITYSGGADNSGSN